MSIELLNFVAPGSCQRFAAQCSDLAPDLQPLAVPLCGGWAIGENLPTQEQCEAAKLAFEASQIQQEIIVFNSSQDSLRGEAYSKESDPLFFKFQRNEITFQVWLDKIAEIKLRYPKKVE